MSGDENTQNDPAQDNEINALFEPSDNKELCNFDSVKSVSDSCFDSSGERLPVYPSAVVGDEGYGGDITNWDVGLNPVQSVGEVFDDIFDTGFQGSEQPEMGNNFENSNSDQLDHGNVFLSEPLSCEPVEDGSNKTPLNESIPGSSVGAIGTVGEKVSNCGIEMTGEKSLNLTQVENETCGPAEVGTWESIYEVAKQSEEIVGRILTECDESETGVLSRIFNDVECLESEREVPNSINPDMVSKNLTPGDKVAGLSPQLPSKKEDVDPDPLKNDNEKHNNLKEPLKQEDNTTAEAERNNAFQEQTYLAEQVGKSHSDVGKLSDVVVEGKPNSCKKKASQLPQVGVNANAVVLGITASDSTAKSCHTRTPKPYDPNKKQRCGRKSGVASAGSSRVLRKKLEERSKTPEETSNLVKRQDNTVERRGRKKRETNGKSNDEFARMRKRLSYFLHKIRYEHSLLDAYSSEGWRGQSVEKIRPEKELQRAKTDINRFKVKIRELFHQLDSMSAEGKFPDSLYDSEGLIDSEDIFCAKCGTKDLPAGNDIILCDGNCDRGFHQYCLDPPLRTEDIPPGDEGWFCPVCDCKFDFVDLINESQGVKLSIEDSWENVFPEAVAALAGLKQDDLMGLPSDDSDDNDYNPGGQDDDVKDEERETRPGESDSDSESDSDESDSSDFSSASEDLGAVSKPVKDDQYLGLPSDDSEDNDFDPDAANANDDDECASASSSSDFSSASEDLGATAVENEMLENEGPSLPDELDQDLGESLPLYGKRQAERLDYKKLYDETYGNAVSDSSDDEEWNGGVTTTKNSAKKEVPAAANGDVSASTAKRRGRPKRNQKVETASPVEPKKPSEGSTHGAKGKKRPPYNKLPESATQRLYQSFMENKYPDHSAKEKLAKELGLTPIKVDKWFGNARWSFNHHPTRTLPGSKGTPATQHDGAESSKADKLSSGSISTPAKTRKRKDEEDKPQTSNIDIIKESEIQAHTPNEKAQADPSETPETLRKGQRKRRKSGD